MRVGRYAPPAVLFGALFAFLLFWEMEGRSSSAVSFFFSYPSAVAADLFGYLVHGSLLTDVWATTEPALIGLGLGALVGGMIGFSLIAAPSTARLTRPVLGTLAAFPVFVVAPMTILWLGLGLQPKVFLAFLACVFVFSNAAYNGGLSAPDALVKHLKVHGFSSTQELLKVRLPYAIDWLVESLRSGANLALLGVFIGEFVTSQHGLARVMIDEGSRYNVARVLSAALCFTLVAQALALAATLLNSQRRRVLRWISVPSRVRTWK